MNLSKEYLRYLSEKKKRSLSTLYAYEKDLLQFCSYLCRRHAKTLESDVNHQLLTASRQIAEDYRNELVQRGLCLSSVNRKLTMLRGFYGWLIETGFLNTNPFESVVRRKPITSSFFHIDTEAIQHLFEIIGTDTWVGIRDRSMLGLLFNTGMRVSELLSIQLKDILWSENRVIIPGNGKPSRSCTLWEWVFDELYCFYQLRQNIDPGKVKQFFINHNGGPLTSRSIRRKFSAYGRRAGFSVPITPAVLRHSYAMLMLQNSVKPSIIKRQLGHRSSSSMRPYLECLKQQLSSHRVEVMV